MTQHMRQQVYQESTHFMADVYQKDAKQTYNDYMSTLVKHSDTELLSWDRMVNDMHHDKLVSILPFKDQKGQFYKVRSSDAPGVVRYGVKLKADIRLDGQTKSVTAQLEWVEENGQLKLFLFKVPYQIAPNGKLDTIYYSLKHYTTVASK